METAKRSGETYSLIGETQEIQLLRPEERKHTGIKTDPPSFSNIGFTPTPLPGLPDS